METEKQLPLESMDSKSRETLIDLLSNDLSDLTEAQVDVLFARRDFLSSTQKKAFGITAEAVKARAGAKAKADKAKAGDEDDEE